MTRFFVSYSRSVKDEVGKVVALLRASGHQVWWDSDIPIIADWWATILDQIEWCDVFIFVASEKSVQSVYCIAELAYANERNRPILPFILDDPTKYNLPDALPHRNQWLVYDGDPAHMLAAINQACDHIEWEKHRDIPAPHPLEPLTDGQSLAQQFQEARRLANAEKFEEAKIRFRNIKELDYREWGRECDEWLARLNSYALIAVLSDDESTLARARVAWDKHRRLYGKDFDPHHLETRIKGGKPAGKIPMMAAIVGILAIALIGVLAAAVISISGHNASSLIPDPQATTTSAGLSTESPAAMPTPTAVVTDMPDPTPASTPITRDSKGVEMVLVTSGCFMMGSNRTSDEKPITKVCFDHPFWIDRYEVTNEQFERLSTQPESHGKWGTPLRPRETITWFQARDFCAARGARLPTEAEWEYAARGPDSVLYPWGNSFVPNNLVYSGNSGGSTADVGSKPAGASWVGAYDLLGNVWEWTSSLSKPYPYDAADGREEDKGTNEPRVMRGGSWHQTSDPYLRASARFWLDPSKGYTDVGFRCVQLQ